MAPVAPPQDRPCNEDGCNRRTALHRAYCRTCEARILARVFEPSDAALARRLDVYVSPREAPIA